MLGLEGGFWIAILTWTGIAVLLSALALALSARESRAERAPPIPRRRGR